MVNPRIVLRFGSSSFENVMSVPVEYSYKVFNTGKKSYNNFHKLVLEYVVVKLTR